MNIYQLRIRYKNLLSDKTPSFERIEEFKRDSEIYKKKYPDWREDIPC
tara:strand:+ start:27113 stop:27256 length:144 start_codon:yes stop_codon:yes gene_type:complete